MKKAVLALCALSLMTGCGRQDNVVQPAKGEPMPVTSRMVKAPGSLIQMYTVENCSKIYPKAYSPSMTDWPRFVLRLDPNKKYIETSINISCIQKLYSKKEIVDWKDKGDPVAILAYLDKKYRDYNKLCDDYDVVKSLLRKAQQVKVKVVGNNDYIMRAPEAYILETEFTFICLGVNDGGLLRQDLELHNIAPDFFDYYTE